MAMFITEDDYKVVVGDTALKIISQASGDNLINAQQEAQEEISAYLRPKYDCTRIFSAAGSARNRQIVMYTCDIALYHLVSAQPQKMGSEVRRERYGRAVKWLEGVQAGKIIPDLPLLVDSDGEPQNLSLFFGCQKKQRNNW